MERTVGNFELSDELREMIAQILFLVFSAVLGSSWWAKRHWSLRIVGRMAAPVVRDLMVRKVQPMKADNQANGGAYDLTAPQGKEVLETAKTQLRDYLVLHDLNKKPLVPSVAPLLNDEKRLEKVIEAEVKRQKQIAGRVRPGGKGFR